MRAGGEVRRLRPGAGTSRIFAPGHGYMILTGGINASMVKEHFVIIGDTGTIVIPVTVQNYMDHLENNDQETSGFVWSRGVLARLLGSCCGLERAEHIYLVIYRFICFSASPPN